MAENVLEKIINIKSEKILELKKNISLESLEELIKKRAFRALFYCALSIKRKINRHKPDILVRLGWHRRIVPTH